ncbi:MAG: M28 family peptidase [Clostridia bacterium]|nr:M28 family peptidase [Clostridia bacterium]
MTVLEELLEKYPVRHSREQKEAFRAYALQKARDMGYKGRVEQNGRFVKHNNVVFGDPDKAVVTFTAHYDTPSVHLLPSLLIPRNVPVFYAWQLLSVALLLLITLGVTMLVGAVLQKPSAVLWTFVLVYFGLLFLLNYGPANCHNANNNTSGVAALLTTMEAIPEEWRGKVAFILFDDSEKGKQGSSCYSKTHLQVQCVKTVINLDCVGVGEDVLVIPKKLAKMRPEYMRLCSALQGEERGVYVLEKGLNTYTSDHDCFQCGVGIIACKKTSGIGWYVPHLNTAKDTQCSQENIDFLARRFSAFARML